MGDSKFTPGPWAYSYTKCDNYGDGIVTGDIVTRASIAIVCGSNYGNRSENGEDEFEANARLIAAAPELLEALEQLISGVRAVRELPYNASCAAHVRAYKTQDASIEQARAAIAKARGEA